MALLRESKRKADQSSITLQADLRHSMTELQEMHQEFEVTKCTANAYHDLFFFLSFLPLSICLSIFLSEGVSPSICAVSHHNRFHFNVPFFHPGNTNKMQLYNESLAAENVSPHKIGIK